MKFLKTLKCDSNIGYKLKNVLKKYKVVLVKKGTTDENFWELQANKIGELFGMKEDSDGNKTGSFWTDIKYDPFSELNTFLHSNTRQPLHTDGSYELNSPDISFFFCKVRAKYGGATTCLDLSILINCMKIERPELLKKLMLTEFIFSKGYDSKISKIIDDKICNWIYFRVEKNPVTEEFHNYLESRVIPMNILLNIYLDSGDALFFNDKLILHGRNAFLGDRWLKKGGIKWN